MSRPTAPRRRFASRWLAAAFAAACALPLLPAALVAQRGTIDPGMSRAQVEDRLGAPKGVRSSGDFTYLFYANGCERECGMDDLVVLERDAVVDAVFRSPNHRYTGVSSSPAPVPPAASKAARRARAAGGTELVVPANDGPRPAPRPAGARKRIDLSPILSDSAAPPVTIDSARNGQMTTTGPVDAGRTVQNTGPRLYPSATPVPSTAQAGASAGAAGAAEPVPFQGSKLSPADSVAVANRRAVTIPGQVPAAPPPAAQPPARPPATPPDSSAP